MSRTRARLQFGATAVLWLASIQVLLGLAGLLASALGETWVRPTAVPDWQRAVLAASFGALATRLVAGARRDLRATTLGIVYLLIALFFARPPMLALAGVLPEIAWRAVDLLRHVTVDAFLPFFAWLFVREFPQAIDSRWIQRLLRFAIGLSFAAGCALLATNLASVFAADPERLSAFTPWTPVSHYWTIVFGLLLPVPPMLVVRARIAPPDERRRVRILFGGIVLGSVVPVLQSVLPQISAEVTAFLRSPAGGALLRPLNLLSLLAIAATTSYAVLVQKVLDVRAVLQKAAQYALARLVIAALAGIPFAWMCVVLYRARKEALGDLFVGARALQIGALVAAGVAVLRVRVAVMSFVDRFFFREAYDARRVLAELAERSRGARSIGDLVGALTGEVDRALHPDSVALLVESRPDGPFVAVRGPARSLERDSALVTALATARAPVRVNLERLTEPLDGLPDADRTWLADAGAEALVPLVRSDGRLAGMLALGPKQSELGYSRDDLLLLAAIGASAGLSLENLLLRESAHIRRDATAEERLASECARCGQVEAADASECSKCGGTLRGARLPRVLFDKFELEARVGEGAMGIVYRANDLALARPVALKTLPATSPEDSVRLRREARAMASIRHPHLALIFGAETWRGEPILVLEYLARGTLADRIERGPLPLDEALRLGAILADVLATVHGSGLLHRDVKPSNVGFAEDGTAKLLDFGLSRIAGDAAQAPGGFTSDDFGAASLHSRFAGTPLYMSPEALSGERPEASFDVRSLAVVVYESATGKHPFERATARETEDALRHARLPAWEEVFPGCPSAARLLLESALSPRRSERPASAREFARSLSATAAALAA